MNREARMGLDFLDLIYRLERVFEIRIHREIMEDRLNLSANARDIRVRDLTSYIEFEVQRQNPEFNQPVFPLVKQHIAECLDVPESEVIADAWMIRDLGMS
jgi:hypothetical protein